MVEEAGLPGENHWPWTSNWQTLSLAVASRVHPFCNLQRRARTQAVLVIGLYELLGNPTTPIAQEQTTQWRKEKVQRDKQRSTKHTYKTKDRVTRTPLKTGGELGCSGRVGSPYYTSDTRRVNLVTNPVLSHESWINVKEMQVKRPNAHQWGTTGETFVTIHCYLYTAIPQSKLKDKLRELVQLCFI